MTATEIILERDTANDESAILVKIHVKSGDVVAKETLLFEVENSKAVQEVWSTHAGILKHDLAVGQNVEFGVPFARIVQGDDAMETALSSRGTQEPQSKALSVSVNTSLPGTPSLGGEDLTARHYSRAAAALLAKHPVPGAKFDSYFVTSRDVLKKLGLDTPSQTQAAPSAKPTPAPPETGLLVTPHKRMEIKALSQGAGNSMLSVMGVSLGHLDIPRPKDDFLNGRITDFVIYEASRLMKKYPRLNASYQETHVLEHEAVHAGLAMDSGRRLVVYGIEHADRASLAELSDAIADAADRYLNQGFTPAELSRATFIVTDLSEGELDFVLPLLPCGQSCILGITRSASAGYRIYAGFDHRVTEGREVASFLGELRDRLLTFAATHKSKQATQCDYCGRSAEEAFKGKEKGLLKVVDHDGLEYLCCASCWNGW